MSYPDIEIAIKQAEQGDLSLLIERVRQLNLLCQILKNNAEGQRLRAENIEFQYFKLSQKQYEGKKTRSEMTCLRAEPPFGGQACEM